VANAATTFYTGPAGGFSADTWNNNANWDSGTGTVPAGIIDVEIESGRSPWAVNSTPSYTGSLTLRSNATLGLGPTAGNNPTNALGTGTITMESGSQIIVRTGATVTFSQAFTLTGAATIQLSSSTAGHNSMRTFSQTINGAHQLTLAGQNGNIANLNASNGFSGFVASDNGSDNWKVVANVSSALGVGDVTIGNAANLVINHANAMFAGADLFLNGPRSTKVSGENKLVIATGVNFTVAGLHINGTPVAAGTYNSTSGLLDSGGNNLISGLGSVTVIPEPSTALLSAFGILALLRRRRG
jgi:hypothetical protein